MATWESIRFDLEQARKQADAIDGIADDLDTLQKDKLEKGLQTLSLSWKGWNSTSYGLKGSTLRGQISTSASNLRGIASDIRTIAQNIYNAEAAALRIAEEREYNR